MDSSPAPSTSNPQISSTTGNEKVDTTTSPTVPIQKKTAMKNRAKSVRMRKSTYQRPTSNDGVNEKKKGSGNEGLYRDDEDEEEEKKIKKAIVKTGEEKEEVEEKKDSEGEREMQTQTQKYSYGNNSNSSVYSKHSTTSKEKDDDDDDDDDDDIDNDDDDDNNNENGEEANKGRKSPFLSSGSSVSKISKNLDASEVEVKFVSNRYFVCFYENITWQHDLLRRQNQETHQQQQQPGARATATTSSSSQIVDLLSQPERKMYVKVDFGVARKGNNNNNKNNINNNSSKYGGMKASNKYSSGLKNKSNSAEERRDLQFYENIKLKFVVEVLLFGQTISLEFTGEPLYDGLTNNIITTVEKDQIATNTNNSNSKNENKNKNNNIEVDEDGDDDEDDDGNNNDDKQISLSRSIGATSAGRRKLHASRNTNNTPKKELLSAQAIQGKMDEPFWFSAIEELMERVRQLEVDNQQLKKLLSCQISLKDVHEGVGSINAVYTLGSDMIDLSDLHHPSNVAHINYSLLNEVQASTFMISDRSWLDVTGQFHNKFISRVVFNPEIEHGEFKRLFYQKENVSIQTNPLIGSFYTSSSPSSFSSPSSSRNVSANHQFVNIIKLRRIFPALEKIELTVSEEHRANVTPKLASLSSHVLNGISELQFVIHFKDNQQQGQEGKRKEEEYYFGNDGDTTVVDAHGCRTTTIQL